MTCLHDFNDNNECHCFPLQKGGSAVLGFRLCRCLLPFPETLFDKRRPFVAPFVEVIPPPFLFILMVAPLSSDKRLLAITSLRCNFRYKAPVLPEVMGVNVQSYLNPHYQRICLNLSLTPYSYR